MPIVDRHETTETAEDIRVRMTADATTGMTAAIDVTAGNGGQAGSETS